MTPRDRDPAVWEAAYGAAFAVQAETAFAASNELAMHLFITEDVTPRRVNAGGRLQAALDAVNLQRCVAIADAAVLTLPPEPPDPRRRRVVDPRLAALDVAEQSYLLAAGWRPEPDGAWSSPWGTWSQAEAVARQRERDQQRPNR